MQREHTSSWLTTPGYLQSKSAKRGNIMELNENNGNEIEEIAESDDIEASEMAGNGNANDMVEGTQACPTCMKGAEDNKKMYPNYVYAMGKIEARFPSLGIEKEFAQIVGRTDAKGMTDQQTLHSVLSKKENRYIARRICWVMTIEGLETYLLKPRDPSDLDLLLEAIRPVPRRDDLDIVIGILGPMASPDMCNGLVVPLVFFDQIYSFDVDSMIKSMPRPEKKAAKDFETAANELFERIIQMADNAGATDEHRAMNYLSVRYPAIYAKASQEFERNCSLSSIEVVPSRLSGMRKIMDVIFTYVSRETDVAQKFFVRVDVTEEFPFLVTKMSPYYDR
jgi:hypothetical protein